MRLQRIILASAVLVSVSSFAQKDELKKLKKIYEKESPSASDLSDYKANLDKLASLATEEGDKISYNYYKVSEPKIEMALLGPTANQVQFAKFFTPKSITELANVYNATLDYERKIGKRVYSDDIAKNVAFVKPIIIEVAIALADAKQYKQASEVLYASYQLDKNDQDNLFYAASYAANAEDLDKALEYYNELKRLKYTGERSIYFAFNTTSKVEENFGGNKDLRDLAIKAGSHTKPREEKIPSKAGTVYKNIALILVEKGKVDEARAAVAEARKANPEDNGLIITEAELYLQIKDYDNYTRLVNEALQKNPNNVDLVYNLGVVSGNANKLEDAEKYYRRAIELDPNYFNALLNLSELLLRADEKFVTEMNKLGTSEKDNKRYEVIKAERNKNFKSMLPYLEKAFELKPDNDAAKKTLLSVYNALEMTDKYKALKAK
ncbi:tetratricopeptide repeat protein [Flavobacterium sp. AS60]|uniref:tetratricopeptide repeat protein n=1 Tax=Flavobacterium anseongense TaxID=2910677 RepID=UPI001F25A057|nr:tetratricopeptide repeat protein [Flavobacterium sp. AS60]MCF6129430.1 tetratricopeptide repeat protein [Flavobacterium sp. AS60]